MSRYLLIVEDNRSLGLALATVAERHKFEPLVAGSLTRARELLETRRVAGILLDLGLPDGHGLALLENWPVGAPIPPVAVITAHGEIENAIESRKLGVSRFFSKPVAFDELEEFLAGIGNSSNDHPVQQESPSTFIGAAPAMQAVFQTTAHACSSREPLVIRGAGGTGRTHLARLVGSHSAEGEFVWHHASGQSSADAVSPAFASADSTLVIEDVVALPESVQRELLRLLHESEVSRLPRLIVTCGEEGLRDAVNEGQLEEELYYRLQVLEIHLPSLSDRISDLPALVAHFLGQIEPSGRLSIGPEVMGCLSRYGWPGNLRELRNMVSFLVGACGQSGSVQIADLPGHLQERGEGTEVDGEPLAPAIDRWLEQFDLASVEYREVHARLEAVLLEKLLDRFEGKPSRLARELGINRSTLRKKLRESGNLERGLCKPRQPQANSQAPISRGER